MTAFQTASGAVGTLLLTSHPNPELFFKYVRSLKSFFKASSRDFNFAGSRLQWNRRLKEIVTTAQASFLNPESARLPISACACNCSTRNWSFDASQMALVVS